MIMDCAKYAGLCVCGREHTLETKKVVVEDNALSHFEEYMEELGLTGRRTVVYDEITWKLTEGRHMKADQNIVLDPNGLRAEDVQIEKMMEQLDKPEVLVAVGAGTIMDFGRYPAYKLGIPFVAIPTLASSDGFTANICSAILNGQKKSTPMCAPVLVVADLDIIKGAPKRLIASGINDILAKYISLADWRISHLVDGEYYCPMVAELAEHALKLMRDAADKYAATGEADHEAMTMAQMESGLTMQLLDHSRAASGAEHLMAHIVEMHPPRLEKAEGIHGECVGVGTFACIREALQAPDRGVGPGEVRRAPGPRHPEGERARRAGHLRPPEHRGPLGRDQGHARRAALRGGDGEALLRLRLQVPAGAYRHRPRHRRRGAGHVRRYPQPPHPREDEARARFRMILTRPRAVGGLPPRPAGPTLFRTL